MQAEEHNLRARRFLDDADAELAAGDELQASEKLWGAAAHSVIAVAQRHRWDFGSHRSLTRAVNMLATATGDSGLIDDFVVAQRLHANFYHGFLEEHQLTECRLHVRAFVPRVLAIAEVGDSAS